MPRAPSAVRSVCARSGAAAACVAIAIVVGLGVHGVAAAQPGPPFTAVDLGTLGGRFATALTVGADGRVFGTSLTRDEASLHVFVWKDGVMSDLGALGDLNVRVAAVTDEGQVVGDDGNGRGFSWTPAGGKVTIGTLGGPGSSASGVSATGRVIGTSDTPDGRQHAFSWTPAGGIVDVGALPGFTDSYPAGVASTGQIAGESRNRGNGAGSSRAFSWTPRGGLVDVGTLSGDTDSTATAVTDDGRVLGVSWSAVADGAHAFSWTAAGGISDLGPLGGGWEPSLASVTERFVGETFWSSASKYSTRRAVSWTAADGRIDLGTLGGRWSSAAGVNSSGQVVGASGTQLTPAELPGSPHAFSWTAASGMVDLGTIGGSVSAAVAVAETGHVVGSSAAADGSTHAVLWLPSSAGAPPQRGVDSVFLCYSRWQVDPGVWPFPQAISLNALGYWRPFAVAGGASATRLGDGTYSLVCDPAAARPVAGAVVDGGGDLFVDGGDPGLGFYPLAR